MNQVDKLLDWCKSQIGVKAGSNNVVKYNQDYGAPGKPWCVMFIWDGCRLTNMPEVFFDGKKTASCTTLYKTWAEPKGYYVPIKNMRPGDWVIFEFGTDSNPNRHIGVCESFDGKYVTSIDGNTCAVGDEANGMQVMRRKRSINCVKWVIRPPYKVETPSKPESKPVENLNHPIYYVVKRGDTLSKIAVNFGYKSYKELLPLNPSIENPNKIITGQKIRVK